MHPETAINIPEGIGLVPYCLPGSAKIAELTLNKLSSHDVVIWEKHGVCSAGKNVAEAFDLIDILAKSAKIYFTCRSAGFLPTGLSDEDIEELRQF